MESYSYHYRKREMKVEEKNYPTVIRTIVPSITSSSMSSSSRNNNRSVVTTTTTTYPTFPVIPLFPKFPTIADLDAMFALPPIPPPREKIIKIVRIEEPQRPPPPTVIRRIEIVRDDRRPNYYDNIMMKSVIPQSQSVTTETRVIRLTSEQEAVLQEQFNRWPKAPHNADVILLAAETGLSEQDVQDWFTVRLAELRKEEGLGGFGIH